MTDLPTLADRVAQAEGADREIDILIERSLPCSEAFARKHLGKAMSRWNENAFSFYRIGDEGHEYQSPRYTASLDIAMTLLPEGVEGIPLSFKVERFYLGNGITKSRACVWDGLGSVSSLDTATEAATPALALCAAALRARHASGSGEG